MDVRTLPEWEFNSLARWIGRACEKYFEDPEVQKRFEEWKKQRELREAGEVNV